MNAIKSDEPLPPTTREHPQPTASTVKRLYGSAFRCALPTCSRPLYKINDETGERVLNSRIAHIHARSSGGPRWKAMSSEENRSEANLVLLCIEHSYEVDDFPDQFPAELLRSWKESQIEEYEQVQRGWPLNDAEAGETIGASSSVVDHHHADAILGVVRTVERLNLAARLSRQRPAVQAAAWIDGIERARQVVGHDENGENVYTRISAKESAQYEAALIEALEHAHAEVLPLANEAKVELAAAETSRPTITPWTRWVSRTIDRVLKEATTWPGPPELKDTGQFQEALDTLSEARLALGAAWRGEEAPTPPPAPQPEPVADQHNPLRDHLALLERARPYARVTHRPYDEALRAEMSEAASAATGIPSVMSRMPMGLEATCRLAAAVSANATDAELALLAAQDAESRPLSAAFCLLDESARVAKDRGRPISQQHAEAARLALWSGIDWADPDTWDPEDLNLLYVLWAGARMTSSEAVKEKLTQALKQRPELLHPLVVASAGWVEEVDRETGETLRFCRRHSRIAPWFPVDAVVETAASTTPVVVDRFGDTTSDDAESLLAQILWAAKHLEAPASE